jgi:hypothetical protein
VTWFSALTVDITASLPLPAVPKDYFIVGSWSQTAVGARGIPPVAGAPILELVDVVTPALRTTWGDLKSRFR